jgi:hypothetical protein
MGDGRGPSLDRPDSSGISRFNPSAPYLLPDSTLIACTTVALSFCGLTREPLSTRGDWVRPTVAVGANSVSLNRLDGVGAGPIEPTLTAPK